MVINSRAAALLLAASISVLTTLFLLLVPGVPVAALYVTPFISFSSAYILIYLVLESLIFKEINNIYSALEKIRQEDFSFIQQEKSNHLNPLKRINQEIFAVAELKQREIDELKNLATYRREFIADISHELKTPIFAAQGFIHTLLDGAMEDKSVRLKFLKKAAKSLDGLDILVQDLLALSQIESGAIKLHFEEIALHEMAYEVIEQFEEKASKKNISITFKEQSYDFIILADAKLIHQVLVNLISNAVKYTKSDGHVQIHFEDAGHEVNILVKDTGKGIPDEDVKRVFERFYRVDKSRSKLKDKGGTGLGLAIVKHIIEAHNSKVIVTTKVGEGSTFSFKLPKAAALKNQNIGSTTHFA